MEVEGNSGAPEILSMLPWPFLGRLETWNWLTFPHPQGIGQKEPSQAQWPRWKSAERAARDGEKTEIGQALLAPAFLVRISRFQWMLGVKLGVRFDF